MNKILATGAALLASTTLASAGGLDRSGQGVGALFENGEYAEFSLGVVMPNVTGTLGGANSGNAAPTYTQLGGAYKKDFSDQLSAALIFDQPYGAHVSYDTPPYPLAGVSAEVTSYALTALLRYKLSDNFSVHGGLKYTTASAELRNIGGGYSADFQSDAGLGYVAGVAYERPEIAMRVALTYSSETDFSFETTSPGGGAYFGQTDVTLPQSVNLDFQTGVAADTLVFGSIRWADYKVTEITPAGFVQILSYDNNPVTYSLGVGRKFNDSWSGALTLGFEEAQGGVASDLAPSDGNVSLGLGATYTMDDMKITGGVRYVKLGDATTGSGADFSNNSVVALGLKVGFNF